MRMRAGWLVLAAVVAAGVCGCVSPRSSNTARTAVEQLLLSTAADRAVSKMNLAPLKGRKVFLDVAQLETYDKPYVVALLRDRISAAGALLVGRDAADTVVEPRAGALATDSSEFLFGLPELGFPEGAGGLQTAELPLYKKTNQLAEAKLALMGIDAETGERLFGTGTRTGSAYYHRWVVLFVSFDRTDIPQKR